MLKNNAMNQFEALSPLDGRYYQRCEEIRNYFSEKALFSYRILVEVQFFQNLCVIIGKKTFSESEKSLLNSMHKISNDSVQEIKLIELKINHDVKAVEYYIKDKLSNQFGEILEFIHFGLTSNDINNFAYSLMLKDCISNVIAPKINQLCEVLNNLAQEHKNLPMLARTHGQPASPTTLGKELYVFSVRLKKQLKQLQDLSIEAKLNGATGTFAALHVSYPNIDWINFSKNFITKLGLKPNLITSQTLPSENYSELFDILKRVNNIVIDLNQDIWRYISDDWFKLKIKSSEVGSSTMPHKVNPINFENSEGVLGIGNALLEQFSRKLPISRLQRDLSDSVTKRFIGSTLGCCLIGYKSTLDGLEKIEIHSEKILSELKLHPEIITEAIQTILRKNGYKMPYEKLKNLMRGKKVTLNEIYIFINELQVPEELKLELKQIKPENYIGLANKLF